MQRTIFIITDANNTKQFIRMKMDGKIKWTSWKNTAMKFDTAAEAKSYFKHLPAALVADCKPTVTTMIYG